jgi:hypothetical protein
LRGKAGLRKFKCECAAKDMLRLFSIPFTLGNIRIFADSLEKILADLF